MQLLAKYLRRSSRIHRYYSSDTPVGGTHDYEIFTQSLDNHLKVIAVPNRAVINRLCVLFTAGPRYETHREYGTTQILRLGTGISTRNSSQFAIIRNIQKYGAKLYCSVDRELIGYTLEGTKPAVERTLTFLGDVVSCPVFKPWEIEEVKKRAVQETQSISPKTLVIDLLHKVGFRKGLGNSMFVKNHDHITTKILEKFVASKFVTGNCVVIGWGMDSNVVMDFANSLSLNNGCNTSAFSKFRGGDIRVATSGHHVYVALGVRCGKAADIKKSLIYSILNNTLGSGGVVHSCSRSVTDKFSPFYMAYTDAGLFGIALIANPETSREMVSEALHALQNISITEQDVERAKKQLQTRLLFDMEQGNCALFRLGAIELTTGETKSTLELIEIMDSITFAEVKTASVDVTNAQVALAAVGNLKDLPYLDELDVKYNEPEMVCDKSS